MIPTNRPSLCAECEWLNPLIAREKRLRVALEIIVTQAAFRSNPASWREGLDNAVRHARAALADETLDVPGGFE